MSTITGILGNLPRLSLQGRYGRLNAILGVALIGVGALSYLVVSSKPGATAAAVRTATVQRGVVLSSVSATGTVQPATQLTVNFQTAGRLVEVDVKPGQHVRAGQVLGRLDPTDAAAAVAQAEASLATAKANLAQAVSGETAQQRAQDALSVKQARASVATAQASLGNAKRQLKLDNRTTAESITSAKSMNSVVQAKSMTTVNQAKQQLQTDLATESAAEAKLTADQGKSVFRGTTYANVADAVAAATSAVAADQAKQQADQLTSSDYSFQQTIDNQKLSSDRASGASAATISADQDAVDYDQRQIAAMQKTISADGFQLTADQSALSTLTTLQNTLTADQTSITSAQAKIVSDRSSIASAVSSRKNAITNAVSARRTAIVNARNQRASTLAKDRQSIQTAKQQIASAKLSVRSALASNAVKQQPAQPATLAQDRAAIIQAENLLTTDKRALEQTVLTAPASGVVASVSGMKGTQVSAGGTTVVSSSSSSSSTTGAGTSSGFVSLVRVEGMQVRAAFSEADATKIQVGQAATITLSALTNVQLAAHISAIDTTSTTSASVVQYYATFTLDRYSSKLRSGMTASVSVTTAEEDNVLHVPTSAVTGSGANARVTVFENGVQRTATVVAGITGDSATAILSGLKQGDTVVLPATAAASSSSSATTGFPTGGPPAGGAFSGGAFPGGGFGG